MNKGRNCNYSLEASDDER